MCKSLLSDCQTLLNIQASVVDLYTRDPGQKNLSPLSIFPINLKYMGSALRPSSQETSWAPQLNVQAPRLSRGILPTLVQHWPTFVSLAMLDLVGHVAPFLGAPSRPGVPFSDQLSQTQTWTPDRCPEGSSPGYL